MLNLLILLLVNDTLESVFDESGDEEEQDAIVSQVLDEIGIEISGKVSNFIIFFLGKQAKLKNYRKKQILQYAFGIR